jgi:hypothetical protein
MKSKTKRRGAEDAEVRGVRKPRYALRFSAFSALKEIFMKTPREIIFARHQAAAPKLDAVRREVVSGLNNEVTKEQSWQVSLVASFLGCSSKLWLELVWPCRRIWTGLAAVWILLFIVNFSQRDGSQTMMAKSAPTAEMMMTFRDQQNLLNELLADRSLPADAGRPRIYSPKPRTETTELFTA